MTDRIKQLISRLYELHKEQKILEVQHDLLDDAIEETKTLLEVECNSAHPIRLLYAGHVVEIDTEHSSPNWLPLTDLPIE